MRKRDIRQADGNLLFGRARLLGAFIQLLREVEVVHGEKNVPGGDEIVRSRGSSFTHSRFRESQRHLLASVVILVLIRKQARKGQPGFDAIGIRSIERAREALLCGVPFSEQQESVACSKQHGSLVRTLFFGELYVLQRLRPHLQFSFSMSALRVEERIIRLLADRDRQLINRRTILVLVVERVGECDV